jgi:hypothetical protein
MRMAYRKIGYSKRSHAQAVLDRMLREGAPVGTTAIYKCPICTNRYHIGHDKEQG